jgi:hypothetical protein
LLQPKGFVTLESLSAEEVTEQPKEEVTE